MNKAAIEFLNLSKTYKKGFWGNSQPSITNLNLIVPTGKIFGFLGANGAGKTTSIKILMGLQKATEGKVLVLGETPEKNKERIGYLPERPYFHENLTTEEFLNFHKSLFSSNRQHFPSNEALLNLVGMTHAKGKLLKEFSKGMLQRIGIAQALVNNPDIIILDEPMSGLDPIGRRDVRNLIQNLAHQGKTIFFSSHILADVESLCHQIAFLDKGVLKYAGDMEDILHRKTSKQEIFFRGISADKVSQAPTLKNGQRTGDAWKLVCANSHEAQLAIQTVWELGAQLLEVHAHHPSLEEALFGAEVQK